MSTVAVYHPEGKDAAIVAAARGALAPWSTVEEKLAAIDALSRSKDQIALETLEQAFLMVGLSRTANVRAKGVPAAGEVSGAAAKALGVFPDGKGLSVLRRYLLDPEISRVLRESSAYGLAGLTSEAAISLMCGGLCVTDRDVRFRVLLAVRESLERVGDWNADHLQELLHQVLVTALSKSTAAEHVGMEIEVLTLILARYGTPHTELRLGEVLLRSSNEWHCEIALRVLTRRNSVHVRKLLLAAFLRSDRPATLYLQIASDLAANSTNGAIEAAERVRDYYPIIKRVTGWFSAAERERRIAHLESSQLILARLEGAYSRHAN